MIERVLWNYILHAAIKNKTKNILPRGPCCCFTLSPPAPAIRCEVIAATVRYKQLIHIDIVII